MKRAKRKIIGARDAKTGKFVPLKRLTTHPARTVAITKIVK